MRKAKKYTKMIVMHPLPRFDEISPAFDSDLHVQHIFVKLKMVFPFAWLYLQLCSPNKIVFFQ